MVREILALGLSVDKGRIGVKTALCFGLSNEGEADWAHARG